jgi:hypothetical protein
MEMLLVAPGSFVIVVAGLAGGRVEDDRVEPVGQLDDQPGDVAAVDLGRALDRLGQCEPAAGRRDRSLVADLGLDGDDVTQVGSSGVSMSGNDMCAGSLNAIHIDI